MNSKWLVFVFVAVLVLLALYVASLGLALPERRGGQRGGQQSGRRVSLNAPWVQDIRLRLTTQLEPDELRLTGLGELWGCRLDGAQITVPPIFGCEFEIAPADKTRAMRMQLVQGSSATFTLRQKGALTIENEQLDAGAGPGLYDIYRRDERARLTFTRCEPQEEDPFGVCHISLN